MRHLSLFNEQTVIIHEFQFSEIWTIADFYRDVQIINPSIKPTAICEDVNVLLRIIALFATRKLVH